jgi:hypothetical protein
MSATMNSIGLGNFARAFAVVASAAAFVLGISFAIESLTLVLASPATIAEYHFGSESMVAHGGWHYRSRAAYAGAGFAQAALLLSGSGLLLRSARRAALRPLVAGGAVVAATLLYGQAVLWSS